MTRNLPLISAGALGPILEWMEANDSRSEERLAGWDLSWIAGHPQNRPVPLLPAVSLFVELVRAHGPDLPCRMAMARGILQLGPLGARALAAGTVGGAVRAIATAMPRHCTNEMMTVQTQEGGVVIRDLWSLAFDDAETAHAVQQYVAALFVSLFRLGCGATRPALISVRPHPVAGLDHIMPWFGDGVLRATQDTLVLSVPSALAQSALDMPQKPAAPVHGTDWPRLRTDGTLTESVLHLVRSMLGFDTPTVDRVAGYASMRRRSLQRRLADEGTSFSAILDAARRDLAVARAGQADDTLATLSSDLGYAGQASLSRAFRRWTGAPPSRFGRS
jgi:AraC-like DNA-binding protein